MQQRVSITASSTMESDPNNRDDSPTTSPPSSRGRHNTKLKVLVRSHAMREEASSPPRVPSPYIKLIPSNETLNSGNGNPIVVLSPSTSCGNSPVCVSPTSTLVPSPNSQCTSPTNYSHQHHHHHQQQQQQQSNERLSSPSLECELNNSPLKNLNKMNLDKENGKNTSHINNINNNGRKQKLICDCVQENCSKCKSQERNINNNVTNLNNNVTTNTLSVNKVNLKGKLKQQSSGSIEGSSPNSPCLSRDSSSEQYTDTSGIDLELFIPETLNRNARDRAFMLRVEQELVSLAKDKFKTHYKFPPMSSYQRMLVHRCAAYFGMEHNIESSGKCVVVNKTKNTRIPEVEFKEHIKDDIVFSDEPKRSILKRDSNSIEDYSFKSPDRQINQERRSKSFEEREEEYEKVRRRIFNRELCLLRQMHDASSEDFEWAEVPWSSTESDSTRFRLQLPENRRSFGRLIKVQSEESGDTLRPYVAKSYSFGGYGGVLNRGDSVISTHSAGPRLLTKQDSAASSVSWRLSPSSSGYKSQSQMSESVTPSPTSTPYPIGESTRHDSDDNLDKISTDPIVWAVTDMQSVPKGSIIINPQTGEPYKNEDGSLYHYDPNNPPIGFITSNSNTKPPPSPKKPSPQLSPTKKKPIKSSPNRKSHFINSSTSPSLPYSPPPQTNKNIQFISGMGESIPPQYPVYTSGYPTGNEVSLYQQPYIIYTTPYGMPQFDNRMDASSQLTEIPGTVYVPESSPTGGQVAYQQNPNYWNQPPVYYQTPTNTTTLPPHQRFNVPLTSQNYISTTYPTSNYMPPIQNPQTQPPPPPPPLPPPSNTDLVPVYHHPVLYSNNTPFVYHNVYQNPMFTNPVFPQNYPQNSSTPNSCSSLSYNGHIQDNFVQITQNMAQMNLGQQPQPGSLPLPPPPLPQPTPLLQQQQQQQGFICSNNNNNNNKVIPPPHFDVKQQQQQQQKCCPTPKGNKFSNPKFIVGSSQSSTGTSSPATTIVTPGYCPPQHQQQSSAQNQGIFRTPSSTPPNQFNYGPNFAMPSMLFRQMSNVRGNTPGTARSSRSPTPASDIQHFERQRMFPPTLYHGMPYVLQSDGRVVPSRSQFYRQTPPNRQQNYNSHQGSDNRSQKVKKSKGSKILGLSQNGKPPI